MLMWTCIREEEAADLEAFQRQYEDDQSWTALQEDEYGRLRPLVRVAPDRLGIALRLQVFTAHQVHGTPGLKQEEPCSALFIDAGLPRCLAAGPLG